MRLLLTAVIVAVVVGWGFSLSPATAPKADSAAATSSLYLPLVLAYASTAPALPTPTTTVPVLPTATPTLSWPTSTPTRTATPIPTSTPDPCSTPVQALQNGGFEAGNAPWFGTGAIERSTLYSYEGSYSAWFGGYNNAEDGLIQTVPVPSWATKGIVEARILEYGQASDNYTTDRLRVQVIDGSSTNLGAMDMWNRPDFWGNWILRRNAIADVQNYQKSSIILSITARTDASYPTSWFVDNVKVYFGCGSWVPPSSQ